MSLDDRAAKLRALVLGLNESLSGDFSKEQVNVASHTTTDRTTVAFGGTRYLNGVRLDITANVAADMAKKIYQIKDGTSLGVNALRLDASGRMAQQGRNYALDLAFAAPKAQFKEILSLVPAVYKHDFDRLKTSGSVALQGQVKGEYGKKAFPAFSLAAQVQNGSFQYPNLALPARDIALDLNVTNPGGSADNTVVDLKRFHIVIGQNPVDASMLLRTPISDPAVNARVQGTVDLGALSRTIKLDSVRNLSGTVAADAAVNTRKSWVDNGQYDRIGASGIISAHDVHVEGAALRQPVTVKEAVLALAPRRAELRTLRGTAGSSDFGASGYLDNVVGYLMRAEDLRGSATLTSNKFVLDEWKSDSGSLHVIPVPKGLDFTVDASVRQLLYGNLQMTDAHGKLLIKDQRLTLQNFALNTLGGSIAMNGYYETTNPAKPTFDLGLRMQQLGIPQAVTSIQTLAILAPAAKYAQGTFSTDVHLTGPLQEDMTPVLAALTGQGLLQTSQLHVKDFPALQKLAEKTKLTFLTHDAIKSLRSQFEIRDGRFRVKPFTVNMGQATMQVAGSNGIDQSLDYDLEFQIPQALMGQQATKAIAGLVSKAAAAGVNLQTAPTIGLAAKIGGTVKDPSLSIDLAGAAGSAAQQVGQAVQQAAEQKAQALTDTAKHKAQAAVDTAAQRMVREAEARAAQIRAGARAAADTIRRTANQQAQALVAKAGNDPFRQAAAKLGADRIKKEGDTRATQIVRTADARADSLVAAAKRNAQVVSP